MRKTLRKSALAMLVDGRDLIASDTQIATVICKLRMLKRAEAIAQRKLDELKAKYPEFVDVRQEPGLRGAFEDVYGKRVKSLRLLDVLLSTEPLSLKGASMIAKFIVDHHRINHRRRPTINDDLAALLSMGADRLLPR